MEILVYGSHVEHINVAISKATRCVACDLLDDFHPLECMPPIDTNEMMIGEDIEEHGLTSACVISPETTPFCPH